MRAQTGNTLPLESPRDAVLAIAFAPHDSVVRNRLPRVVDELHGWIPLDSMLASFRRGATARREGYLLEPGRGDTVLRIRTERSSSVADLIVRSERREGEFALVRAELYLQGDTTEIVTTRLVAEDGIWKLMGVTIASRPYPYGKRWETEDVRLTDPSWWAAERAFLRRARQWEAKERLRELREALAAHHERYGQFPLRLSQLSPPSHGASAGAERFGLFPLNCASEPCTRDGFRYHYTAVTDEHGRVSYYGAAVFQQFPGEEPYLLAHLDPVVGVMDPEESVSGRIAQRDPLVRASSNNLPRRATQQDLDLLQAQVQLQLTTEFFTHLYRGDFIGAAREADAYRETSYRRFGLDHPLLGSTLTSLATVYAVAGQPQRFEVLMQEANAIASQPEWSIPAQLAEFEASLGGFYLQLGNLSAARPLLERAAERLEDIAEEDERHELWQLLTSVSAYLNLATLYAHSGRLAPAERVLSRLRWRMPEQHVLRPQMLWALADVMLRQHRPETADSLLDEADRLLSGAGIELPGVRVTSLGLRAEVARQRGRLDESEALRLEALAISESLFGHDHVNLFEPMLRLAEVYFEAGKDTAFEAVLGRLVPLGDRQLQLNFTFMSERERLAFTGQMESFYDLAFSYLLRSSARRPESASRFYDLVLRRKGAVAVTLRDLRRDVEASGDSVARTLLRELAAARAQLAARHIGAVSGITAPQTVPTASAAARSDGDDALSHQINELEKQLLARRDTGTAARLTRVRWQEVSQALQRGEAAVEYVHFQFRQGGALPQGRYVALVLPANRPEGPLVVDLGPADAIEVEPLDAYGQAALTRGFDFTRGTRLMGAAVWDPIERRMGKVRRVYVAPDGALNQLNLGLLTDGSGKLLMERLDLRLVTSTRRLAEPRTPSGSQVVLIGDPDYRLAAEEAVGDSASDALGRGSGRRSRDAGGALERLPRTRDEVDGIARIIRTRWDPVVWLDTLATEGRVKSVRSPRVLHLATHGFFLPDQRVRVPGEGTEEPMLRSGVYLSGAARTLVGEAARTEDGVLTALEASSLQLDGTELVVLSACDTGLGRVVSGEGVLGLQRALQHAGAESVLMSLWSVPDAETAELMALFYQRWVRGEDAALALRQAQLEMRLRVRRRYGEDRPYYWGAFVLLR